MSLLHKSRIIFAVTLLVIWVMLLLTAIVMRSNEILIFFIIASLVLAPFLLQLVAELLGKEKVEIFSRNLVHGAIFLIGSAFVLLAIGIILIQIYDFLRTGSWESFTVIHFLTDLGSEWAIEPNNWYGLWNILSYIPMSIATLIIGLVVVIWSDH